ncbi:hypothetical protein, variant [Aphanomyces invadans]|uniref:Protein YIPF n=1 Tax=Aphanomyces invadans TaxID=157072 RepID=A0A024TSZ2_9STRA|nr:hypothetical protein, variant [Aphanomyces invadans]ETV97134.1 hypothetical protein, variant [Aphanomyces invadans]|eukprot:XP_008874380.1 hypothetical protein, variant [Aphanomyces invadans]
MYNQGQHPHGGYDHQFGYANQNYSQHTTSDAHAGSYGAPQSAGHSTYPGGQGFVQSTYTQQPHPPGGPWYAGDLSAPSSSPLAGSMGSLGDQSVSYGDDFENEPPLMEELGINFEHIWTKTQAVLIPTTSVSEHILDDVDLAGPLVFAFGFGMLLLMSAKIHFGYIYGFGLVGCLSMWTLMNLISPTKTIDVYRVCSVLGYSWLPIILLAAINIVAPIKYVGNNVVAGCSHAWWWWVVVGT